MVPEVLSNINTSLHSDKLNGFSENMEKRNIKILKLTKTLYYAGYPVNEEGIMSEFYLLYRICHQKILKRKIIDYVIKQINNRLSLLREKYHFDGEIISNMISRDWLADYNELIQGNITVKEMNDRLYGNLSLRY